MLRKLAKAKIRRNHQKVSFGEWGKGVPSKMVVAGDLKQRANDLGEGS